MLPDNYFLSMRRNTLAFRPRSLRNLISAD
jgi:hypothetical protein